MSNVEFRSEQSFGHARIFSDIRRFEQARYDGDAACAGGDHLLEVIYLDSTDAENRQPDFCMNLFNVRKTDRHVLRFCRRRENRTESNVVRAFALRCQRLLKAMRRFS